VEFDGNRGHRWKHFLAACNLIFNADDILCDFDDFHNQSEVPNLHNNLVFQGSFNLKDFYLAVVVSEGEENCGLSQRIKRKYRCSMTLNQWY
tara:strand:+ start:254 stop:529 length:276 start_codon:yes stop_codon:yes gene_type:complete